MMRCATSFNTTTRASLFFVNHSGSTNTVRLISGVQLDATLAMKEKALAKVTAHQGRPSRYRPDDRLLAFPEEPVMSEKLCRLIDGLPHAVRSQISEETRRSCFPNWTVVGDKT